MHFDGQEGYLATVPNATVNNFIDGHLSSSATSVWAGGEASDFSSGNGPSGSYRAWYWGGQNGSTTPGQANYGGPLAGQSFTQCTNLTGNCVFQNTSSFFNDPSSPGSGVWYFNGTNDQEPNNTGGTESYLTINYSSDPGKWNDVSDTNTDNEQGFIVEYGDQATGASSWSSSASASSSSTLATAPGVSTGVSATAGPTGSGNLLVSWSAPSNGNSPITSYTVTATPTSGSPATCTTTSAVECTVGGLTPGAQYTVSVAATNVIGTGSGSAGTVAYAPLAIPGAPTGVSTNPGAAGSGAVAVSWSAPADTGGSAVTAYSVTATPGSGPTETCNTAGALTCSLGDLAPSTTYAVSVTTTTVAGTSSAATTSALSPAAAVPDAPTGVSANPGAYSSAQIAVSWGIPYDGDSAITGYTVTATPTSGSAAAQTCTTTGALSCTVGGLDPGITYTVTVSATNAVGTGGLGSTSVSAPVSVPGAPVGPTATSGATGTGAITLSWSAPTSTGGSSITGYTVTATPTSGSGTQTCVTSGATQCTVTGLVEGAQYTMSVVAANVAGVGNGAATSATAPLALPGAPTGVSTNPGAAGSGAVTVSWSAPADTGGSAVTGYNVSLQGGGSTQTCTTAGATTCTVNGLAASTTYAVSVIATTVAGTSSAAAASVQSPAASVPTPPTGLSATPGATSSDNLLASWSAPTSDGDSAITGYAVTATPTSGNSPAQTCVTTGGLSCTVGGLDPGAQYTVSVVATNLVGAGNSTMTTANAPLALPGAPTALNATPGVAGSAAMSVSWAAPASDGGSPVIVYTVTATPTAGNSGAQTCTTSGATSCNVTGLDPGIAYTVTVTATTAAGVGADATTFASAPATTVPDAPGELIAIPGATGSGTVTLTWIASSGDGGSPITGYTVSTSSQGDATEHGCATTTATSCTVSGLTAGVDYIFTLAAVNAVGSSATIAATAQAPGAPTLTPTPPTPAAGVAAAPVSALNAGLVTSTAGALAVPLTCVGSADCTADGTLTARTGRTGRALQLASFSGVDIGPGAAVSVPTSISATARLAIYKQAFYRVRVTLTVSSHLSDGETAVSVQPLWLNVSKITGCQNDVGRLTVRRVGRLQLGMSRRTALRLGRHWRTSAAGERFAVAGGAIQVAFPDAALLRTVPARRRAALTHRVMIILTGNHHYSADGVKAGMTVTQARRALHPTRGITIGGRTWYLVRVARGTIVLKTRRGIVREVGVAARALTTTRAREVRLLHHF
jgi:Tfp pilus assembly protein PilE